MKIHPVFHVLLLKPYNSTLEEFGRPTSPPAIMIPETNQEEYEVETILNKRIIREISQYLIKWKGYLLHNVTWKQEGNLTNAQERLREFELMRISNLKKGKM